LGVLDSTVWVSDLQLRRVTVFGLDGNLVQTIGFSAAGGTTMHGVVGMLRGGTLLGVRGLAPPPGGTVDPEYRQGVFKGNMQGQFADTLFSWRVGHYSLVPRPGIMIGYQPFDDGDVFAPAPALGEVIVVERRVAVPGVKPTIAIARVSTDGRRTTVAVPYTPVAISRRVADSVVAEALSAARRLASLATVDEAVIRDALFVPSTAPTVTAATADADGSVWLRREDLGGSSLTWTLIDRGGLTLETISLKRNQSILASRRPLIWILGETAGGEQTVSLARVIR
jgi:hypothetical protein